MEKHIFAAITPLIICVSSARADSPLVQKAGITVSGIAQVGVATDDEPDLHGSNPMAGFELGYRFRTGTEPYVGFALGIGGKEGLVGTGGFGLRQRFKLSLVEPFVEAGFFKVNDGGDGTLSFTIGAGVDFSVTEKLSIGVAGGHYFSNDKIEASSGSLDWYARTQLTYRLGQ